MENGGSPIDWRRHEWKRIYIRRQRAFSLPHVAPRDLVEESDSRVTEPKNLVGLAVSGGGIRSALYNDGFLQGLSHRGLLRYVDYVCSVSGGGYIVGHLTSQASDKSKLCFHDDPQRSKMGRDPVSGELEPERLAGIGGYLSRTLEFLPAYLWSFFFTFAFYFGAVGVLATLAALFWRSFDDPIFRGLYRTMLGPHGGSELLIAFIPAMLWGVLGIVVEGLLSIVRLFVGFEQKGLRDFHVIVRKVFLLTFVLAFLTSIAIFLGNGFSSIQGSAGTGQLYLNHYAQWFAILAGGTQILIFLGRDRLFKSERGEAKPWQRHLQQSITTVVLLFLIFSMIHWMGREDISDYTGHRDPHFVQGDVSNTHWMAINEMFSEMDSENEILPMTERPPDPLPDAVKQRIKPKSSWIESLATSRFGGVDTIYKQDLSTPQPNPRQVEDYQQAWHYPRRLYGAAIAYYLVMTVDKEKLADEPKGSDVDENSPTPAVVRQAMRRTLANNEQHREQLEAWNKQLDKERLTWFLVRRVLQGDENWDIKKFDTFDNDEIDDVAILKSVSDLFDDTTAKISSGQRKSVTNAIRNLLREEPAYIGWEGGTENSLASVNRILLEAIFPSAIKQSNIPSTMVVPPHDQRSRKRWLGLWMGVMLLGMVGGLGPHRVATVFNFYRKQLGNNFLVAPQEDDGGGDDASGGGQGSGPSKPPKQWSRRCANKELHELRPTLDGLPYPLMLAASLEPSTLNGSYHVEARPFVFSPMYCGRFGDKEPPIPSKQVSFTLNPLVPAVTLGDAVTLSGAAVTPLMTSNRWLSIILDFFNTGIGQRLRRVDRTDLRLKRKSLRPLVSSFVACAVVLWGSIYVLDFGWSMTGLAVASTMMLSYCVIGRVGSPGLIRLLVAPRRAQSYESGREVESERSFYVADGGYCDYLGVSELLRRRCELIIVSDAGANIGSDPLGTLARMCESESQHSGIRFLDLDHEAPIDFGRLEVSDKRLVHQPYLCMRIRYPESDRKEGLLFYCQMSITESDPIEIQHIRNLFPSFPDEPTVNQFYTEQQVTAYRSLGYHIANRLCHELQNWKLMGEQDKDGIKQEGVKQEGEGDVERPAEEQASADDDRQAGHDEDDESHIPKAARFKKSLLSGHHGAMYSSKSQKAGPRNQEQPLFTILKNRLLIAYRLACYQEHSYRRDDIFSEAIWPTPDFEFPTFRAAVNDTPFAGEDKLEPARQWLRQYERSADIRSAYRTAVINDINALDIGTQCFCETLWSAIIEAKEIPDWRPNRDVLAAHLTNIATACQEVHRGRPHAAFQVGGRQKLIHLCWSVADVICATFDQQAKGRKDLDLLADAACGLRT